MSASHFGQNGLIPLRLHERGADDRVWPVYNTTPKVIKYPFSTIPKVIETYGILWYTSFPEQLNYQHLSRNNIKRVANNIKRVAATIHDSTTI